MMPLMQVCSECINKFAPPPGWRFSFCPRCRRKYADRMRRKPRNPVEAKSFIDSAHWKSLRENVGAASGWKCARHLAHAVVVVGKNFPADHIAPRSVAPQWAMSPENIQILCPSCHNSKSRNEQHGLVIDWLVSDPIIVIGGFVPNHTVKLMSSRRRVLVDSVMAETAQDATVLFTSVPRAIAFARDRRANFFTSIF